jgi:putative sterol carrier protein
LTVVLSVAGFPEQSVFDQLKSYANFLFRNRLAAEIYRTSAERMRPKDNPKPISDILEATVQGGKELVASQRISPETMARITTPLGNFENHASLGNLTWRTCIDEGVTLGEFQKRGMVPRPDSIETFLALMQAGFNPDKAGQSRMTMQYHFTGQVEGDCYIAIEKGEIRSGSGKIENPDLTVRTPFEAWMDILTRKADGAQMFMEGKYTVSGKADMLLKMSQFFG